MKRRSLTTTGLQDRREGERSAGFNPSGPLPRRSGVRRILVSLAVLVTIVARASAQAEGNSGEGETNPQTKISPKSSVGTTTGSHDKFEIVSSSQDSSVQPDATNPPRAEVGAITVGHDRPTAQPETKMHDESSQLEVERRSSSSGGGGFRGSATATSPKNRPSRNVIRRIYGEENANVRKEVDRIENLSERSRTGLSNPDHIVPYKNHPFDVKRRKREREEEEARRRETQEGGEEEAPRRTQEDEEESPFKNIRIHFATEALTDVRTQENAHKIDFIEKEILPRMKEYWTLALSVVPVDGNLLMDSRELAGGGTYCGDSEFSVVPNIHISQGVANTDLIIYVSARQSTRFCSSSTLAVAVACNFDQFDRPTGGAINFCLNQINTDRNGKASEAIIEDNVDVAIHEAAHILGMSSNSYRYFYDSETGKPRTKRPFSTSTVTCVDGRQRSGLVLPDTNTMKFFLSQNGQRYASIVTPKVATVARNQFDCQELAGAQLENQPTGSDSCTGDHWDERLFYPEALSGVISPTTNILSPLTLALMEDSGWYMANYSMARNSPWGLGAGCDFVTEPCLTVDNNGEVSVPGYGQGYFCDRASNRGCSPALTHKMACTVIDYSLFHPQRLPDPQFQYFANAPSQGGPRQADYCPLYGSTYGGLEPEQLDCRDPNNADLLDLFSETYGESSECYETTSGEGRCYETRCILNEFVLKVNIRGEWLTCNEDYQKIGIKVSGGAIASTLTCPRLSSACPDMHCPFNCAGRGKCNYKSDLNGTGTVRPRCECFDKSDNSPGCSDSLIPDGKYLEDSSGLFDNLEESFFDPLVAVFVDHPDKWTTASWAWAAGLFVIFLLMILCICSSFWPQNTHRKGARRGRSGGRY